MGKTEEAFNHSRGRKEARADWYGGEPETQWQDFPEDIQKLAINDLRREAISEAEFIRQITDLRRRCILIWAFGALVFSLFIGKCHLVVHLAFILGGGCGGYVMWAKRLGHLPAIFVAGAVTFTLSILGLVTGLVRYFNFFMYAYGSMAAVSLASVFGLWLTAKWNRILLGT